MNRKEIELRKNTLENKLKDTFITDFHLKDLTEEEKNIFLKIALESYFDIGNLPNDFVGYDFRACFLLSGLNMQNFHILKSIKESNDKFDMLNQQVTNLNEQISQMNTKFDTLIELLSKK